MNSRSIQILLLAVALSVACAWGCESSNRAAPDDDNDDTSTDSDSDSDIDSDTDSDTDTDTDPANDCESYAASDSPGSVGCEFVIPTPPFYNNDSPTSSYRGPCFAVMVANDSDGPVQLTLSRGGTTLDAHAHTRIPTGLGSTLTYDPVPPGGIPPHEVAILFLSHRPGAESVFGGSLECPVTPTLTVDTAVTATEQGVAFELESDVPISLYDIIPYGGAQSYLPSASLLYPSTAWGTNYLTLAPHDGILQRWMLFVARDDNTNIDLLTYATVTSSSTVAIPAPGVNTTYALNRGEYIQLNSATESFSGTILDSDNPIGVYTGDTYLQVPTQDCSGGPRDSAHQQIPHIKALGSEYIGAGIPTRLDSLINESVAYRLTGVVDGTQLTWAPSTPTGAPTSLTAGAVVEFETRDFFIVESQDDDHPFSLTQYMSGDISNCIGGCFDGGWLCEPGGQGDTDWIQLVPPAQFSITTRSSQIPPTGSRQYHWCASPVTRASPTSSWSVWAL